MSLDGNEIVRPVIEEAEKAMRKSIDHLHNEYDRLRTGRATPHTLDPVKVNSYGQLVPLSQVANISIPEARMMIIKPWDKNMIKEIEKGIIEANLGLNPNAENEIIRIIIPPLNEERRKQIVKLAKDESEKAKIGIRNARHEANKSLDKMVKESNVSENRRDNEKDNVQNLTDKYNAEVEEIFSKKEKEIMTV